jgi:signal transduction histidine kinase
MGEGKLAIWGYEPPTHATDHLAMETVAVLGHEVRNLLATFVGFSELLLCHDWPREQQEEYLLTMRDEAVRVTRFLNDLLDLERMEAGAVGLKPRPTDVGSLLHYAAAIAGHDQVHPIVLDCPTGLPSVLAEPDRIQQVLANLLSNARKYTPSGGQIRLSARIVRQRLEVSVQDSGIGIPVEALPRVFEKFFRVEGPTQQGIRGTGLGLAISRRIIEAHGGRIWVASDGPGLGARFSFSLPLAGVTRRRAPSASAGSRLSSRGEHIPAHPRDARNTRSLPRPAAAQSSRSARARISEGDRATAHRGWT